MKRIVNVASYTGFVVIACLHAVADGIINGDFEQVSTCPWIATTAQGIDPVVLAPDGNPCSFVRIVTGENEDGAGVLQSGFLVKVQNGE